MKGQSMEKQYYCNPLNLPYRYQMVDHSRTDMPNQPLHIYREAADPSLVLFKGKYYLFPSMTAGFYTSQDLVEWQFHSFLTEMPIFDYAPDVCVIGEYLYFCASHRGTPCSFFRSRDPLAEPFEEIKGSFDFWDPHQFLDDDGRLYFYWGCSNVTPIYGVEMDRETMRPKTDPIALLYAHPQTRGYERMGMDHVSPKSPKEIQEQEEAFVDRIMRAPQELRKKNGLGSKEAILAMARSVVGTDPYIEGPWMTKHEGRYYLQYAIPGTEYNIYGDGVYVSDSPLGPYTAAQNNPYSYKPGGFLNGAGHGSTLRDKNGVLWHTSTISVGVNDGMERRIGLWKAGFDHDGELFCDQRFGDWPIRMDAAPWDDPDWMLLSYGKPVRSSSGNAKNVTDENGKTWWRAEKGDNDAWVEVDLGKKTDVHAIQINFMDDSIIGEIPKDADVHVTHEKRYIEMRNQRTGWLLEGSENGKDFFVLADKRESGTDLPHDFLVFQKGKLLRFVKLTVTQMPYNQPPCVSGVRIFGKCAGDLPQKPSAVQTEYTSPLDLTVKWAPDNTASGHLILWGYAPDKLYHSYQVYHKNEQHIGALIKGQRLFVRVDAFNETGITQGEVVEAKSPARKIREAFAPADIERDKGLSTPEDIERHDDICYGWDTKWQMLDVYRPKNAKQKRLPVIVNVHGGAWVYGSKETYQFYCMNLAERGFAVVNYSYRLAPEFQFPSSLEDTNLVFSWVLAHAEEYKFDPQNIFAVGDSAGAHLLGLYCCACTDEVYAHTYGLKIPDKFVPTAIALNCGKYEVSTIGKENFLTKLVMAELLPESGTTEELEQINVVKHVTKSFPPVYLMTSIGDFLHDQAPILKNKLSELGVPYQYQCWGNTDNPLGHVFHCDIRTDDAQKCNDAETAFFSQHLHKTSQE